MGATLTTIGDILKTQYIAPIGEQVNNATPILERIGKDYDSVQGKNFTIPLHYGRNEGIGARAEGGVLPTAGNQAYKACIVPMAYQYGRFQLTGQTIKAARGSEGAFIKAINSEMKGLTTDMVNSLSRQVFGDGTGALTVCASNVTTTITVASTAKLRVGMPIDILVTATGATTNGVVATSVVSITNSTVFVAADAPAGALDADYSVYVAGSRNNEIMGLGGIISATSTLQGLDVATYPWWVSTILGNSSVNRPISDVLLQTAIDTLEQVSNGKTTALYTSFGIRRAYQAVLASKQQIVNQMELKGGYKTITFNDVPIIVDKHAPANKIRFVDEDKLKFYRMSDNGGEDYGLFWMDEDGSVMTKVTNYDAYEGVICLYTNLGTNMRNAFVSLDDISEA